MKTYKQFNEDLKSWWNKGKNVRIPNEDTASWKTLWDDDIKQVSHSDKAFKSGKTNWKTLRPLKGFTDPKLRGTGPTPIQRQILGRSVKTIKKALPLAGKVAKLVLSRGRKF